MRVRLVARPDMSWAAAVELLGSGRTERRIAGWLDTQRPGRGVDLARTCALQCAVTADEAAMVILHWSRRHAT